MFIPASKRAVSGGGRRHAENGTVFPFFPEVCEKQTSISGFWEHCSGSTFDAHFCKPLVLAFCARRDIRIMNGGDRMKSLSRVV
jgi:hypothetical protein